MKIFLQENLMLRKLCFKGVVGATANGPIIMPRQQKVGGSLWPETDLPPIAFLLQIPFALLIMRISWFDLNIIY